MNDYILLNEDALNLLLVNTHYDLGKPAYNDLDLDYINFLRGIADGRYLENNLAAINDNDPLLKDKLEIISDSAINNELTYVAFFHTHVYLFAAASNLEPSMYRC